MPAQVRQALDRLGRLVREFSVAQRTLAVIGVAGLVLGAVALGTWLARPTLSPLFSGLSATDASAVVDSLSSAGVTYQLANGGSTVLVPAQDVDAQRLRLASEGLPSASDGTGYSLLDDVPMTSSEFQQQTTYQRAVEGELARTISALDGVEQATVKLAIPQDTVFVSATTDPTASVFVRTRTGVSLTADQVQAIVHLVSAGIDGMKPTDVAVVDSAGKVLSAVGTGVGAGALGDGRTADYEDKVRSAVGRLLDPLVGPGRSAVTVTAELDFDEQHRTTEEFSPATDAPPLASSRTEESYTGTGGGATGVLGPDNIAVPEGTSGDGTYSSTSEDLTNAVNKTTEVTTAAPGSVRRQSVAVTVDTAAAGGLDMAALREAVAAAAGIDTERGDTLSVQRMAFDTSQADQAAAALAAADDAAAAAARRTQLVEIGVAALLVVALVVLALVLRARRRRRRDDDGLVDVGEVPAAPAAPGPAWLPGATTAVLPALDEDELPMLPSPPEAPSVPTPVERKRAELEALADEQPEELADLLRGWLATSPRSRS